MSQQHVLGNKNRQPLYINSYYPKSRIFLISSLCVGLKKKVPEVRCEAFVIGILDLTFTAYIPP